MTDRECRDARRLTSLLGAMLGIVAAMPDIVFAQGGPPVDDARSDATAAADLVVTPDPLDFGVVPPGATSTAMDLTVANDGDTALTLISINQPDAPFASAAGGTCAPPQLIAPGASCTVAYVFAPPPKPSINYDGIVEFTTSLGTHDTHLTGRSGIGGQLDVTPSELDFGDVEVGATSATMSLVVGNGGDAGFVYSGIDPAVQAPFALVGGTCVPSQTIAPQTSCTLDFQFAPTQFFTYDEIVLLQTSVGTAEPQLHGAAVLGGSATLVAVSGSGQATTAGSAFAAPLVVKVTDADNQPVAGVTVDFAAPTSGASAVLSAASAVTEADGSASVTAVANAIAGSYRVSASLAAAPPPSGQRPAIVTDAGFTLTNVVAGSDVAVTIDDGSNYAAYGATLNYVVTVANASANAISGIDVAVALPLQLDAASTSWVCNDAASGNCAASGIGALADSNVTVPAGSSVTYVMSAAVLVDASGDAVDTPVSVDVPGTPTAITATDGDLLVIFRQGFEEVDGGSGSVRPSAPTRSLPAPAPR